MNTNKLIVGARVITIWRDSRVNVAEAPRICSSVRFIKFIKDTVSLAPEFGVDSLSSVDPARREAVEREETLG